MICPTTHPHTLDLAAYTNFFAFIFLLPSPLFLTVLRRQFYLFSLPYLILHVHLKEPLVPNKRYLVCCTMNYPRKKTRRNARKTHTVRRIPRQSRPHPCGIPQHLPSQNTTRTPPMTRLMTLPTTLSITLPFPHSNLSNPSISSNPLTLKNRPTKARRPCAWPL